MSKLLYIEFTVFSSLLVIKLYSATNKMCFFNLSCLKFAIAILQVLSLGKFIVGIPVSVSLTSSCNDVITGHRVGNQPMQSLNQCESAHIFLPHPHQRNQLVQILARLIISVAMSTSLSPLSPKEPLKHQNPHHMPLPHCILTTQTPPLHGCQHYLLPQPHPLIS